jgi:xylan 1,4-beta-xylosidase
MFSSYTAACFARAYDLAAKYDVNLEGALTWAFEFENQPPFAGLRAIATDGIDLPVLNVFRMFSKLPEQRLAVESDAAASLDDMLKTGVRERPDVSALAALGGNRLCVLVWHYHDDDVTGPDANVEISLDGLPEKLSEARVQQFRIDADHSNAFTVWKNMNSPRTLTPEQFAQLEKAGHLAEMDAPKNFHFDHGKGRLNVVLPRQAVSLFVFEWPATP